MLFSEPKIPQYPPTRAATAPALRFQCSSASRKFLNFDIVTDYAEAVARFSALQRAENSSILDAPPQHIKPRRFSALQRAENSSMRRVICAAAGRARVSVLFSEPKIPQSEHASHDAATVQEVSVLFSEPKIPQCDVVASVQKTMMKFQCSSASRKFLNSNKSRTVVRASAFQCSSASRKFLNDTDGQPYWEKRMFQCSSASRKFLNLRNGLVAVRNIMFQCSSASRKFLNRNLNRNLRRTRSFQCSSASRKFLNVAERRRRKLPRAGFQCSSASRKFLNVPRSE